MEFKRFLLLVVFMVLAFWAGAQDNFFVYLQTENNQPFYVKLNNRVVSSTAAGYLILPKLKEGNYDLSIGFPKNEFPEENFSIEINDRSEGFLLKKFEDKGWSLFNLQSMALISPGSPPIAGTTVQNSSNIKDDPFSQMLASVLKDSSLLRKDEPQIPPAPIIISAETAPVAVETTPVTVETVLNNKDSLVFGNIAQPDSLGELTITAKEEDLSQNEPSNVPRSEITYHPNNETSTSISRILNVTGRDGSEMIYLDKGDKAIDTIRVFIPRSKTDLVQMSEIKETVKPDAGQTEPAFTITPTVVTEKSDTVQASQSIVVIQPENEKKANSTISDQATQPASQVFIIRTEAEKEEKEDKKDGSIILLPEASTTTTNSDCKNLASNSDFLKVRRKMAAERNNDDMVLAAKRMFKSRCFNTDQIRNLSYLFLNDEGRYMFFDAAYPYTSDAEHFESLVLQLSDEYYINRFKALVQK